MRLSMAKSRESIPPIRGFFLFLNSFGALHLCMFIQKGRHESVYSDCMPFLKC